LTTDYKRELAIGPRERRKEAVERAMQGISKVIERGSPLYKLLQITIEGAAEQVTGLDLMDYMVKFDSTKINAWVERANQTELSPADFSLSVEQVMTACVNYEKWTFLNPTVWCEEDPDGTLEVPGTVLSEAEWNFWHTLPYELPINQEGETWRSRTFDQREDCP
jgi:hypothetical protein